MVTGSRDAGARRPPRQVAEADVANVAAAVGAAAQNTSALEARLQSEVLARGLEVALAAAGGSLEDAKAPGAARKA